MLVLPRIWTSKWLEYVKRRALAILASPSVQILCLYLVAPHFKHPVVNVTLEFIQAMTFVMIGTFLTLQEKRQVTFSLSL